jgi:sporulation integral membrane protein YlbJ
MLIYISAILLIAVFFIIRKSKQGIALISKKYLINLLIGGIAVFITISIVKCPEIAFEAAYEGLDVWFNIVFPALLPFFIGSQLLMGLGVVHFMGVLLEPFMRPLFNVPGEGSFVMAMGLASGYPIGAMLTGKLRRRNLLTKTEAERLMSFCNTADPLFMFGAVAVGMFRDVSLGPIIAAAHYISCIMVGLLLRFYKKNSKITLKPKHKENILLKAVKELNKAREKDGRPFGKLMGDCIMDSINAMLLIGGFIILFSVIIRIISEIGFTALFCNIIERSLYLLRLDEALAPAVFSGIFEITLGTKLASEAAASLTPKVIIASAVIAWSGLSVHAQVASMVSGTDIKMAPYVVARIIHAIFAAIITLLLMGWNTPVLKQISIPAMTYTIDSSFKAWFSILSFNIKFFVVVLALVFISCISMFVYQTIKSFIK